MQCKCIAMSEQTQDSPAGRFGPSHRDGPSDPDGRDGQGEPDRLAISGRPRWRRRAVLGALGLSLAGNALQWSERDTTPTGTWRSEEGRAAYRHAYDEVLAIMPATEEQVFVPTSFGTAHARRFGDGGGLPMLLLPGWGSGIPMWSQNLPGLVAHRTVWAVDAIGDAGLSSQDASFADTADEAQWVAELISALHLPAVHVVGHSFGARIAAEVARQHPDLVATLSLLEPVQVFSGFPWELYLWAIPATLPFVPQSWKDASLRHIGGATEIDRDDPLTALIATGTEQFEPARPFPARLTDDQLASLPMPVLTALGGASTMHDDVEAAEQRAREHLREGQVRVWPEGTHSLPMESTDAINEALLAFLAEHESG